MTRKPLADIIAEGESHALRKTLGPVSLTALGIGCIIGAGIFVLTGTAAARYAGPGIMLSFVIGGIACAFVGLCYAELAALLPVAGSTYTYTYATLGEIFAWIIGWDLILEYAMGASTVAVGWSGYIASLLRNFGITIPPQYAAAPWTQVKLPDGTSVDGIVNIPAALIVLALTAMLIGRTKESARLNNIMVAVKLFVVVAFILLGAAYVTSANWHPLIPANTGEFGHFGWTGVVRGASVVFFAFIGFDAVSTAAQEAKLPQRDMPIGILGSLVICTILYVLVAAVVTGLVPYTELNVPDPIAKAVDVIGMTWFSVLIKIGALAGLTTVILVLLYGQSRVFFTIAKDGLLPKMFSEVHPTLGTPYKSQLLIGIVVAIVAALTPIDVLGEMVSIGTLFAFALVCGAVVYLRKSDAEIFRPFRTPAVPWVPSLGIAFSLLLMVFLPWETWLRLIVGWRSPRPLFRYRRSHSVLMNGTLSVWLLAVDCEWTFGHAPRAIGSTLPLGLRHSLYPFRHGAQIVLLAAASGACGKIPLADMLAGDLKGFGARPIGTTTTPSSSATMMSPGITSTLAQAMGTLTAKGMMFVCAW
jgi:APA family basic amino acid/polyamine antiporter